MSLRTKTFLLFICSLVLIFLSVGIWKRIELDKYQKRIAALERKLMSYDYYLIDHLDLFSLVYSQYLSKKDYIQEITGGKKSVLIYRYNKFICSSCLQEDMFEIERFLNEIGREKILLLPAYPDRRESYIELTNVLEKFNYVNIPVESFLLPTLADNVMQRYFAVIDKEGDLTMVFFLKEKNKT